MGESWDMIGIYIYIFEQNDGFSRLHASLPDGKKVSKVGISATAILSYPTENGFRAI